MVVIKYFSKDSVVDTFRYEEALTELGKVWVSVDRLKAAICYCKTKHNTLLSLASRWIDMLSNGAYSSANRETIPVFLQEYYNVLPDVFINAKNKDSTELSVSKATLKPLLDKNVAPDLLENFLLQSGYKNRAGTLQTLLYSLKKDNYIVRKADDEVLCEVPFAVIPITNQRFVTAEPNVIGFPKEFADMFTVPDDKVLVFGDFPQIDARIAFSLFLMDKDSIGCYNRFPDDMYAALACWVRDMEIKHNPDAGLQPFTGFSSKEERNLYKVFCLRAIYGTVYDPVPAVNKFIRSLRSILDLSPKYSAYQRELRHRLGMKQPVVVQSYFGHKELAPTIGGECFCLNSPVQATSSGVIILTVLGILGAFRNLGYTKDDISVYMVRHDEPIFLLSKKSMKDSWIFADYSKIYVESMVPFDVNWSFGEHYTEKSEELEKEFNTSVNLNLNKIEKVNFKLNSSNFSPLRPHYLVDVTYVVSDTKLIVAFLNKDEMKCDTVSVKLNDSNVNNVFQSVLKQVKCSLNLSDYEAIEFSYQESTDRMHWSLNGKVAYLQPLAGFSKLLCDLRSFLQFKLGLSEEDNGFSSQVTKWGVFSM